MKTLKSKKNAYQRVQNTSKATPVAKVGAVRSSATRRTKNVTEKLFNHVELCIHKVVCDKTTREILKKDKMKLVAIETMTEMKSHKGKNQLATKIRRGETLDLGKFGKGDIRNYKNSKVIARFPYGGADAPWPRTYPVTLVLVEIDGDNMGKLINGIVKKIEKDVVDSVSRAAASVATGVATSIAVAAGVGASVGSVIPVAGTMIGSAVGAGVAAAVSSIEKAQKDDCFPPKVAKLNVAKAPAKKGTIAGSKKELRFSGFGGIYRVTYSWQVS